ncbi:MAG: DUF2232 domain-containing protein [Erysipelotrichaceae bacterium]|nr:DUF2232 domain-containing protein [Erysipelotrichaceae bacterium]
MNNNVRKLTEGAMMVALVGIVMVLNRQLANALDVYLMWILPFPVLIYTIRYGVKNAVIVSVCSVIVSFMFSLPTSIFYVAASCVIGLVYGYGIATKKSNGWLLGNTILCSTVVMILTTFVLAKIFGYNLSDEIALVADMANKMNLSVELNLIKIIAIISLFLSCVLEGFLIHMLAFLILRKLKIDFPQFKPLHHYRAPKWLGYLSILVIIAGFVTPFVSLPEMAEEVLFGLRAICLAVDIAVGYLVLVIGYAVQGNKKGVLSLFVRVGLLTAICYALSSFGLISSSAVLLPVTLLLYVLVFIGILDMVSDFRSEVIRRFSNEKSS